MSKEKKLLMEIMHEIEGRIDLLKECDAHINTTQLEYLDEWLKNKLKDFLVNNK